MKNINLKITAVFAFSIFALNAAAQTTTIANWTFDSYPTNATAGSPVWNGPAPNQGTGAMWVVRTAGTSGKPASCW